MNGKHITKLGFEGKAVGLALTAAKLREDAGVSRGDILDELQSVQNYPEQYRGGAGSTPTSPRICSSSKRRSSRARAPNFAPRRCPTAPGERT